MAIVKWILSVLFVLPILFNLPNILAGDFIVQAVLLAIATALVLPPLDPIFNEALSFLKSNALRIFLAVILAIGTLAGTGGASIALESAAVCATDNQASCANQMTVLPTGVQPLTVQGTLYESSADEIDSVDVVIEALSGADADAIVIEQTIDLPGDSVEFSSDFDNVDLKVGTYKATLTASRGDNVSPDTETAEFVVLPTPESVAKRDGSEEGFSVFKNTISELMICVDPGGEDHCDDSSATIPSNTQSILADAVTANSDANYTWLGNGPEISFFWRFYPEGLDNAPEIILEETVDLGEGTDVYGFQLSSESGFPPGDYDVVALIETANSQPVRTAFSVTE